jgi:hypothetical protein
VSILVLLSENENLKNEAVHKEGGNEQHSGISCLNAMYHNSQIQDELIFIEVVSIA